MKTENDSVVDGTLTNEQLGGLMRRNNEVIRRIQEGNLEYEDVMLLLQKVLIENNLLYLGVAKGTHEIKLARVIIDCDKDPSPCFSWTIQRHTKNGKWEWNHEHMVHNPPMLERATDQESNGLFTVAKEAKIMNGNILDFLLLNKQLIPKEWKELDFPVVFLGTIYEDFEVRKNYSWWHVRYLYWHKENKKWLAGTTRIFHFKIGEISKIEIPREFR